MNLYEIIYANLVNEMLTVIYAHDESHARAMIKNMDKNATIINVSEVRTPIGYVISTTPLAEVGSETDEH